MLSVRTPTAVIARHQRVGGFRAGAAGSVVGKIARRLPLPTHPARLHRGPCRLDLIGALEQRRRRRQAIVEQRFIANRRLLLEPVGILEIHRHAFQRHFRPRPLGIEAQTDAFIRLDLQDQPVGAAARPTACRGTEPAAHA